MLARAKGAAAGIAATLFVAMFVLFAYKLVLRYAFGITLAWADELGVILFIWVIFWACAFVMSDREQIVFDLLYKMLPESLQRGVAVFRLLLIGGLFAATAPTIFNYLQFLNRTATPVLRWPVGWVYSCFFLLVAAIIVRCAIGLVGLSRAGWRTHL